MKPKQPRKVRAPKKDRACMYWNRRTKRFYFLPAGHKDDFEFMEVEIRQVFTRRRTK